MDIRKSIQDAFKKDRSVLFTLLIVPIIVPFLLHAVYGGIYVNDIPFGVVDMDNTSLSRSIVQGLDNHPGLDVSNYYYSEGELEDAISNKKIYGGMVIPKGLSRNMNLMDIPKVAVIVDGSNMMIGSNAGGYCSAVLGTFNAGIQMDFLKGNGMQPEAAKNAMATFSYGERVLYEPFLSYISNLVYIIIPFVIQTYFLTCFLLPAYVEEKHYWIRNTLSPKEKRQRMAFMAIRIMAVSLLVCFTSYCAFYFYSRVSNMPLRGGPAEYMALTFVFLMSISAVGLAITAFLNEKNLIYFIEFYFIISSVIILTSGAIWPEYMMPGGLAQLIKMLWPFFHVAMPIKYVNLKGASWDTILPYLWNCIVYFMIWLPAGLLLMKRKIELLKEQAEAKKLEMQRERNKLNEIVNIQ